MGARSSHAARGAAAETDRRGGPSGLHDFEVDLPNGSIAALEVTGEVDKERLGLAASAERHLSSITLPVLSELEASGRRKAQDMGDPMIRSLPSSGRLGSSRSSR